MELPMKITMVGKQNLLVKKKNKFRNNTHYIILKIAGVKKKISFQKMNVMKALSVREIIFYS